MISACSEESADWSTESLIDYADGCEDYIADFLSTRDLINFTEIDGDQREKHEKRYKKEWDLDEESTRKGVPKYKKYREEHVNKQSKCNAQFINNLHTFYGDGSRLHHTPKPHYAVDLLQKNAIESEETNALKKLEVSRNKVTLSWLSSAQRRSSGPNHSRRSQSCIPFHVESKTKVNEPNNLRRDWSYRSSVHNADESFQLAEWCSLYNRSDALICQNVAQTFSMMTNFVNTMDLKQGIIKVSKVLFSTDDLFAYIVLEDAPMTLEKFSSKFSIWYTTKSKFDRENLQKKKSNFWRRINVVLYLPECEEEGTMFRRARHICKLSDSHHNPFVTVDLYVELDTGMLRVHESSRETVLALNHSWAQVPPAIIEVRFKNAKDQQDVTARIEEIRRSGQAFIDSFDVGNREKNPKMHFKGDSSCRNWTNIETAVLKPLAHYEKPGLMSIFCDDRDCTGMCCSENLFPKNRSSTELKEWEVPRDQEESMDS